MSAKDWIEGFALFAKVAKPVVESFFEEHPELIDEDHPDAPKPPPTGLIDDDVAKAIDEGSV